MLFAVVQAVLFNLQSTFASLFLQHFRGILVGFVISMFLTDLRLCVDSAADIPSSLGHRVNFNRFQRISRLSLVWTPNDAGFPEGVRYNER